MSDWIISLDLAQEKLFKGAVVFFHHAGGAASNYICYRQRIPSYYRLFMVQLPGRESHLNPLCYSAEYAASKILIELTELVGQLPVIFFGHSMGASLAWKTAQLAKKQSNLKLIKLVLSARRPPHLKQFEKNLLECDDEQVIRSVCHYGFIDTSMLDDPIFRQDLIAKIRADFSIANSTQQIDKTIHALPLPIMVCGGSLDDTVALSHLSQWSYYTLKQFQCVIFPGDHFYIFDKANQVAISKALLDSFITYL